MKMHLIKLFTLLITSAFLSTPSLAANKVIAKNAITVAPTVNLTATPSTVALNANTVLVWSSNNASTCNASGSWTGSKTTSGSLTVSAILSTKTFTLTCTGAGGTTTQSKSIALAPAPTLKLSASKSTIGIGGNTILNWTSANSTACTASGGWSGNLATSGSFTTPKLNSSTLYTLTCSGAGGKVTQSTVVIVSELAGSRLGINLNWVNDWGDRQNTFVDVVKQSRGFISMDLSHPVPLDANGWPTTDFVVYFITGGKDQLGQALTTTYPSVMGTYTLSFNGTAVIGTGLCSGCQITNQVYNAATNTTTANITINNQFSQLAYGFINTNGGVKNLKLLRPGYPLGTKQVFTNEFLNAIAPFSTLRFMDFLNTNNSPVTTWAERSQASQPSQQLPGGVAWEYVIALANASGKDIWINIPEGVDLTDTTTNNYVTQLATLLKATLNPNIHVYVEYSNELWNYAFPQSFHNLNSAIAEVNSGADSTLNYDASNNKWYWALRRVVHQTVRISQLFANVYGSDAINTIIRPVYMNQFVAPYAAGDGLYYLEKNFGAPSKYLYAIGSAPYVNAKGTETTMADIITNLNASLNSVLAKFVATPIYNGIYTDLGKITYQSLANFYGLKNVAYEGGAQNAGGSALFEKAGNDPSVNTAIQQELADAIGCGNSLFMYYKLVAPAGDSWGAYNDVTVPTEKSKALVTIAETPLAYYNTCTATANSRLFIQ